MRKAFISAAVFAVAGASVAPLTAAVATATTSRAGVVQSAVPQRPGAAPVVDHVQDYTPRAVPGMVVHGPTVPFFTAQAKSSSTTFNIKQIGTFPGDTAHPTSTTGVDIVPVAFHYNDGVTIDPTKPLPSCAGGGTALNRTLNSGLFKNVNFNPSLGGSRQFLEAFRRSEYFGFVAGGAHPNTNYSVRLSATVLPKVTIPVSGPSFAEPCGRDGNLVVGSLDNYLRTTVYPSLGTKAKTTHLTYFLWTNTVLCQTSSLSTCGILGYHNAFSRNGVTQTYGVAEFAGDNRFHTNTGAAVSDTYISSHELGEWLDDPFVDNATPAWGHIGQVSGCQKNLEVGDPLTGNGNFTLTTTTGTKFHVQDLAETPWFYRFKPSGAFNGWYSFFGKFKSPSAPCS